MKCLKTIRLENQIKKELREKAALNKLLSTVGEAGNKKAPPRALTQFNNEVKFATHNCRSNPAYRKYNWPGISTAYRATCSICGNHIGWISKKTFDGISRMKRQHSH